MKEIFHGITEKELDEVVRGNYGDGEVISLDLLKQRIENQTRLPNDVVIRRSIVRNWEFVGSPIDRKVRLINPDSSK